MKTILLLCLVLAGCGAGQNNEPPIQFAPALVVVCTPASPCPK